MMDVAASSKISPFLWFHGNAEEAVDYYLTVFPNSRKTASLASPNGKVLTVSFELEGLPFIALNGDRELPFTNAVSFFVRCQDQAEIDHYWDALLRGGGAEIACGWITDKFGLPWQIVPDKIMALVEHPKAFEAMTKMKKLVIAELEAAAEQ